MTLDNLDLKIIHQLQKDGRISATELAKEVKSTRPTVTNRLKEMIKKELVIVKGGINLSKFGFKLGSVGLEVKKIAERRKVENYLKNCPRVLNMFRIPEKANYHIIIWGEDDATVNSTIESFRDFANVDIIYTHYLGTPIHGDIIIDVSQNDNETTPCGMKCIECYKFINSWCTGCPSQKDYKSPFTKHNQE